MVLLHCSFIFGQENDYSFIRKAINQYWSTLPYGKNWTCSRSSVLQEKSKSSDFYEYDKAFDNNLETVWVEGVPGNGINEYIMANICQKDLCNFNYRKAKKNNGINIFLSLNNGYCKNESLFIKNNRIKKAHVIIYDTPIAIGQDTTKIDDNPIIIYDEIIDLKDTMDEQTFSFVINTREDNIYSSPFVIMQFIILDVYPGTDYDDTCISEIKVYGEYANE